MIEDFLQKKLASLLDQYIEFEKLKFNTTEGMSIRNSKVRPKLVQQMSQIAQMPLELIDGSIESLTLNRPWQKLFFFINSPIKISVQNVHIKTRLKNSIDEEYLIKQKQNLISRLTQGLYNPLDASIAHRSSYINRKLKEHFLGHIILEVKNICFQIEINLTHKIELLFRIDRLTFRKQQRKISQGEKIHLEIAGLGISYRVAGKQYQLMAPTRVQLLRVKTQAGQQKKRTSIKKILIEKLQFNVNNINYGDIARILLLIQWHNSFIHLPYNLWKLKPFILNQIKPIQRLIYYCHLVTVNIKESRYLDQLKIRRQYINLFLEYLADPSNFDSQKKKAFNKMQLSLPLWRIIAYRKCCIQFHKNTILRKRQQATLRKKQQTTSTLVDWFKSWSFSQLNRTQLEEQFLKKIDTLESIPEDTESIIYVSIERLKLKISIQVNSNFQPFICLVGTDCSLRINELIFDKSWSIQAQIIRCKIQYQKYLGHCERYRNLISQCREHLNISKVVPNYESHSEDGEDQFADIGKFIQVSFTNESKIIQFKLLPFDIFLNHQVLQKFAIVMNVQKLSKIWKADQFQSDCIDKTNPWIIIEQQRIRMIQENNENLQELQAMKLSGSYSKPSSKKPSIQPKIDKPINDNGQQQLKKQPIEIRAVTSFNIIIPQNLMINNSPELVIQVGELKFSMRGFLKRLDLKAIMVKFKIPEVVEAQQQGLQQVVNFLSQKMQQIIFIRKFNATLDLEKHQDFDKTVLIVDPLNIQIPQQRFLYSMIELLLLLVPKQKQNRAKQYIRRKASIGEQWIDACQNLKQHIIAKSIIMTSEMQSKKSIIKQKRSKQGIIVIKGVSMTDKMFQLLMGEAQFLYDAGIDRLSLTSGNPKEVKLTIHNMRKLLEKSREVNLHYKKQYLKRGFSNDRQKLQEYRIRQEIELQQFNVQVIVTLKKFKKINSPSIVLQLSNLNIFKNTEDNSKGFQTNLSIKYDQQILDSERMNKVPLIQTCFIHFIEQDKYNLRDRILKMGELNINLKPSLLKFAQRAIKDYHLQQQMKCTIINQTINTLKIKKSQQNYYNQFKNNQKLIFNNFYCEILIFGIKHQLNFRQLSDQIPVEKLQTLHIGHNNFLINKEISPNTYAIQSNVRIINHQDKTLWLKITQNSSSIITPNYQDTRRRLKKLSYTPKRRQQTDLMSKWSLDEEEQSYDKGKNFSINAKKRKNSEEQFEEKIKFNAGKVFNIPLKPKDKIHLLIDQNDFKYIQIYDQGVVFTEIAMGELFETTQLVLKGQGSDEDQYLVIRSEITSKKGLEGSIFTFHIYSPVYIVNKTPWELEYRLSEEQLLVNQQEENKKIGRRKSFQLIPLKSIPILSSEKIRNVHYNQIQTMKLQLNKFQREIGSLTSQIRSIKQKRGVSQDNFFSQKERKLITMRKNKKQIQLILQLQFSMNILKIKIYPQIVFVNMTKQTILFEIKEDQITYPQICLKRVQNIEQKQQKYKNQQKIKKQQSLSHLSQYINITDEKIKSRDALKQLFEEFSNNLQVFTGEIPKSGYSQNLARPKRKIIFKNYSINPHQISVSKLLGLSSRGYVSDYGSQGQFRQDFISLQQQPLQQQNIFVYSQSQYMFYKRSLMIDNYFNLMIVIPTVHIINKTQAIFYAKNSSDLPVKVSKENHNFILTNQQSIYLQASFEQEEISLNQWIKVDLNRLGTIYCSKDMRTHHASGYESKQYNLRKKKMKKIPRMFYRILLCKFQRGQKILIEQSQYPPYSFINNTSRSIKIQDTHQHFIQQFSAKGDMAEYAPLNPYEEPHFRIYVAQNFQYRMLSTFGVQQKKVFKLQKDLFISIQQYKEKIIVNITDKEDSPQNFQQTLSILQRSEGDTLLEQTSKFTIDINKINISVLNQWNRELNSNYIQNFAMTHENKNYKDYYKMQIGTVEGYDYTCIKPDYIYKRRTQQKGLGFINKQKQLEGSFFTLQFINNYHKNAQIIQKFNIKLSSLVFYLSADLILAYVKHFYEPFYGLLQVYKYYQSHRKSEKPSSLMSKTFIFQSLKWFGTSLKIQTRNLSIMQAFLNKNSQKWLVKFINWLGGIKPIGIEPLELTYEQITLMKLRKRVSIRKKINEIVQQMMDYPVSQLKQIVFFMLGEQEKSLIDRINLFKNVAKSLQYVLNFTLSINQNLKPQRKSYQQAFTEQHKNNMDIVKKMISFQFCEWKYKQSHSPSKLSTKIKRLERYNKRQQIFQYDDLKAKIKLAVDHQSKNKLWKKIENVFKINSQTIIAVVNEHFVLFDSKNMQWKTILVESIIGFFYKDRVLQIYFRDENQVKESEQNMQNKFGIRNLKFKNTQLHEDAIKEIKVLIEEQKLSYYY